MQTNGKIDSCEIAKRKDGTEITGKKKDGTPYTNYKYKISGRYYSGFGSLKDFDVEIGNQVIVEYKEEPNKDPKKKPYKNIVNLTEAVAPEGVGIPEEAVIVQSTTPPEQRKTGLAGPDWDKINLEKQQAIMVGMVSNQTIQWIIHKGDNINHENFKATWNEVFDKLWDLNIEKRKEKLK